MKRPEFWEVNGWMAKLLMPAALVYRYLHRGRDFSRGTRVDVPVICVGNLLTGGAGKTPVALALAERLQARGVNVAFLTRGYGGTERGPKKVDPSRHTARQVGDEALLLAARAPTYVSSRRVKAARLAIKHGAQLLIMDDGFQNPALHKDFAFIVVDGPYGFGNGKVFPAGPMREGMEEGLARAQAVIIIGEDRQDIASRAGDVPVLRASLVPQPPIALDTERPLLAFAGIGRPEKFFTTLREMGLPVIHTRAFGDHHHFTKGEIAALFAKSERREALPITTRKDWVRLPEAVRDQVAVLDIQTVFEDEAALDALLAPVLAASLQ